MNKEPAMMVQDLMTADPVTVTEDTRVKTALGLLARHQITSMPVLTKTGALCGVVSEADLIRDLVTQDPRTHEIPQANHWHDRPKVVGEVMSTYAITVRPETDLAQAVELITSTTVKSVPVLDARERVVGMLSRCDVVRVLARSDEDLERAVDTLLSSVGLSDWVADVTEGSVALSGPDGSSARTLAHLVASTVPGVLDVSLD
jgi:CBS domain-containing protein